VGKFATGINDTGGKFATGVNDTGGKFAAGVCLIINRLQLSFHAYLTAYNDRTVFLITECLVK
jgi:hypothetical protein